MTFHYLNLLSNFYDSKLIKIKILLFADDVCLLAKNEEALAFMLNYVNFYNDANNGKLNIKKCTIIPLNEKEDRKEILEIPLITENQPERYLGYEFHKDKKKNGIETAIKKFETNIKKWKNMKLSIIGRANIIKTYGFSLIYYSLSIDKISNIQEKKLDNLVRWFLFSPEEKYENIKTYIAKISASRCSLSQNKGGLKLIPMSIIAEKQKIMWVLRMIQKLTVDGWAHAMKEMINEARELNSDIAVEMSPYPPEKIENETKRITLKNILIPYFKIKKIFNIENDYLGEWNLKTNKITKFYKVLERKEGKIKLNIMKNLKNDEKKILKETNKIIEIRNEKLIPINTKIENDKLLFLGPKIKKEPLKKQHFKMAF